MTYTDLEVQTGEQRKLMRFFLTELGPQQIILGYPWFAAMQPNIDWVKGWMDYSQLPVVLRTTNAHLAKFGSRIRNHPRKLALQRPPNEGGIRLVPREGPDNGLQTHGRIHSAKQTTHTRRIPSTQSRFRRKTSTVIPRAQEYGTTPLN